jgi:DNA-binding MarR family transcriptional regulator
MEGWRCGIDNGQWTIEGWRCGIDNGQLIIASMVMGLGCGDGCLALCDCAFFLGGLYLWEGIFFRCLDSGFVVLLLSMQRNIDFENNLARQVGRLSHLMGLRLNAGLQAQGLGITADQFRLLTHLWRSDGLSQQQLAVQLGRDRATVTRMVDLLEDQLIVTRIPDREDKRSNLIYLTKKGQQLEALAAQCGQAVLDQATNGFEPQEEAMLRDLLERAILNLR